MWETPLSDNAQYRDIYQIAEMDSILSGSVIPQDRSVLDAVTNWDCWHSEAVPGWQFYNSDSIFINLTYDNIRDMIRRAKPSFASHGGDDSRVCSSHFMGNGCHQSSKGGISRRPVLYCGDQCFAKWKEQDDSYDISYNDFGSGYKG